MRPSTGRSDRPGHLVVGVGVRLLQRADGVLAAGAGAATEIGLIPRGTGGDFRRTLELPEEIVAAAAHIKQSPGRVVDAGRVRYRTAEGMDIRVEVVARQLRNLVDVRSITILPQAQEVA